MTNANYLMYSATILYLVCYGPELFANYKNKNANIYNIPEKIIMLSASSLALSYAISMKNNTLMLNYAPTVILDVIALWMRLHYAFCSANELIKNENEDFDFDIENQIEIRH
jgi:uncharacterized protein with PQ loop repeat